MIARILIANRGEIARRIIRTCREMGIATVAVYSEADADAPFVREADTAVAIGPAPATESYLNISNILAAAHASGAEAVHPGYGFLSEHAGFAEACVAAGLIFIGPPGSVIRRTGSKTAARESVRGAGVPVVPGVSPTTQTDEAIAAAVREVGLPALLKATAGGGGRGMRIIREAGEIVEAVRAARREAERAFADGTLYVERLIERPRHVEVQIFGDTQGHVVHLFERDCTLQRRHQKVIEESPAPTLTPAVRARITEAAVAAGRAVGYVNAGTVEFLVHGSGNAAEFYFLEINTRLQVEHPVTEMVTGLDLVRLQIEVASGRPLPFSQADVTSRGHAIEARIYAEDSERLLPQAGRLLRYREPSDDGIRVDGGVAEGQTVTVHYDAMLAKLIAHGPTRADALDRLVAALGRYEILGIRHNVPFLRTLLSQPEVTTHHTHTRFIEEHLDRLIARPSEAQWIASAAAAASVRGGSSSTVAGAPAGVTAGATPSRIAPDPWATLGPIAW